MSSASGCTLTNALVFVDENGDIHRLRDTPIQISAGTAGGLLTPSVAWSENQGILLQISPGEVAIGEAYSAIITWTFQDAL